MSNSEDILYEAYQEGVRDEVFVESKKMRRTEAQWKYKDFSDCIEEAYRRVKERKNKKNENL